MPDVVINGQYRKRAGSFNQFSQHLRIARSRHTGEWIVEELNDVYGYWATIRGGGTRYAIPQPIVDFMLGLPAYEGPLHPEDERFRNQAICG